MIFFFIIQSDLIHSAATGQFLLVSLMARETSLGNIYAANSGRADASVVNPAALSGVRQSQILFTHFVSAFDTYYEHLLFTFPFNKNVNLGFNFLFSANNDLYKTDENGYPVERIDNYDTLLGTIVSFGLNKKISMGINAKLVGSKINKSSVWGVALNAGIVYKNPDNNYVLGATVENLGVSTAYFKEESLYPIVARIGYTSEIFRYLDVYSFYLLIEERFFINESEWTETSFGLEVEYHDFFVFRYGYVFGRDEGKLSLGVGVTFQQFKIDYSYQPFFLSDNVHTFTIGMTFK
ncbi:MAG: PorV/PorQ family protein [Candidatus Goldbacteria bacterium]|nr:PorV/PorQ family protein [Candidatus Goldiibacteriota bacterium]